MIRSGSSLGPWPDRLIQQALAALQQLHGGIELLPLLLHQPHLVVQFTAQLTDGTKSLEKEVGFQRQLQSLQNPAFLLLE